MVDATLRNTTASLRLVIARFAVPIAALNSWQPEDIIPLKDELGVQVDLLLDNLPIGRGELVDVDGQLGVRLLSLVKSRKKGRAT